MNWPLKGMFLVDLLRGDNSLEKPLESSCLGQLNKIFNPCGTVPHSKWDVMMRMGRLHILSLNVLIYFHIRIVHTFSHVMLFDARTEKRKQDMRDMNQTFVLVRIWNESLSGSELCWCLKCFSSVLDIDVWRVFLRQRIGGAKQRSKKSKRRQENWGEMWKNDITSKRQDFGKLKPLKPTGLFEV